MLIAGMYGIVGVMAIALILLLPVILAVWYPSAQKKSDDYWIAIVLVGPLMITTIDSLMNGAIILPYLLIAGALSRVPGNTLTGRPPVISPAASHLDTVCR